MDGLQNFALFILKKGWLIVQAVVLISTIGLVLLHSHCLYSLKLGELNPTSCEIVRWR